MNKRISRGRVGLLGKSREMHKPGLSIDFVGVWEDVPAFLCNVFRH
jgi:hypothetical protein